MNIQLKWYYRLGFLLLVFILMYVFFILRPLWMPIFRIFIAVSLPFLIGGFIAYLLHPVVEKLHGQGLQRGLSILIIYLIFFGGTGYAVYKGVPAIIGQIRELSESAPAVAEQYREWFSSMHKQTASWPFGLHQRLEEGILFLEQKLDSLFDMVMDGIMGMLDFVLLIALIPFVAFYFLKDIESIKRMVWYFTPKKWRQNGISFLKDVDNSLGSYIRGQFIVCATIGGLSSIIFWFIGMKYPLLFGVIIGVTNIIPYFGPIFGAVPAMLIAATTSMKMVATVALIVFGLQFLEGNVLSPLIVGKSLAMHPLVIMAALLLGGEIGGIPGLIVAVPLLAVLKVAVIHAKEHFAKTKTVGIPGSERK
ncbi:putative PurR-regulated permease PerM [Peribacillus deserti]|uniref:PurR-regulated permease PerM n=1 Tax=Peribacillus deserti TaxID=673318 RepID=A0ABS2QFE9_9BACI|nr:AI-2E family transporter [Peribacillus deserti]MBM7691869.1 putative PurR-regulated permease PerM [Peribacillus deserti]